MWCQFAGSICMGQANIGAASYNRRVEGRHLQSARHSEKSPRKKRSARGSGHKQSLRHRRRRSQAVSRLGPVEHNDRQYALGRSRFRSRVSHANLPSGRLGAMTCTTVREDPWIGLQLDALEICHSPGRRVFGRSQNVSFIDACKMRGSRALKMRPKVLDEIFAPGPLKFG